MADQGGVSAHEAAQGADSALADLLVQRLRSLTLDADAHGFAWDARSDVAIATPGFKSLFGIADGDRLDAAAIAARLHPEDADRVQARQTEMLERGGTVTDEFRIIRPDGVTRWIRAEAMAMRSDDGTIVGLAGVNRDISADRGLPAGTGADSPAGTGVPPGPLMGGASLDELIRLGRALPALLWVANRDGFVQWYNERWHDHCGSTPESMAGFGFQSVIHPDDVQRVLAEWVAGIATGAEFEIIYRLRKRDGSYSPYLARGAPARDANGAITGWSGLNISIGAERAASEKLARVNAELAQALVDKDMLLYEVNHRVKNSLQLVTSLLGMQARKSSQPELQAALGEASERIAVIAALHEGLYAAGAHTSVDICVVLADLVRRSVHAFAADGRIAIECDTGGHIVLPVDRAIPLALVVSELVTNAVKYAFPGRGGRIALGVTATDDVVRVAISDDGVGLPDDGALAASSGIGMRVVDAFVRQLRATMGIDRTPPGTRVTIDLPLV